MKEHKTILEYATAEIIEKKSRFIASLFPAASEEEAVSALDQLRRQHSLASHNCYAYRIMRDSVFEKYSDDGEPSQTAGLPILGVISGARLYNVLAVVTRYFGGTLLGTGGLVRAYSQAVKAALTNAIIIEKRLYSKMRVLCDYSSHGKIVYELAKTGVVIGDSVFGGNVELAVFAEKASAELIQKSITDITSGQAVIITEGDVFGYKHNNTVLF